MLPDQHPRSLRNWGMHEFQDRHFPHCTNGSEHMTTDFNATIIGSGAGGLTAAVALA